MNSRVGRLLTIRNGRSLSVALAVLLIVFASSSHAQSFAGFDDFLQQYEAAPPPMQTELARSFVYWQQTRGGFPAQPNVPRGTLHALEEPWATPKVTVYLPPGYDSARDYPTLYTADGSAWISYIGLPTILDNLIAARAIEPVVAVLIDAAADRGAWYHFNSEYLTYLKRVDAYVDDHYGTRARADARVHAGTSAGGKATAYVGFELQDVFGNLAMLSSSLSGPLYYFEPYFSARKSPNPRLRVWTSAGTYEGFIHRETETMAAYFKRVGIPVEAVYVHQGHSFGTWRENAVEMLRYFFASPR